MSQFSLSDVLMCMPACAFGCNGRDGLIYMNRLCQQVFELEDNYVSINELVCGSDAFLNGETGLYDLIQTSFSLRDASHRSLNIALRICGKVHHGLLTVSNIQRNDENWTLFSFVPQLHEATNPQAFHFPLYDNQLAFTRLLSQLTSQLINASCEQLDDLIEQNLGAYGAFRGVDRCYLFKFSDDYESMSNTHEWVADNVEPYKAQLQQLNCADLPYLTQTLSTHRIFKIGDVATLPASAFREKAEFERENIRSILCVALHLNEQLYGFVGCDIVGRTYTWQEYDVQYLKLIGDILSNTLESQANRLALENARNALEQANKKLEKLAHLDGLTEIANRRLFDTFLARAIRRAARNQKCVNLLMIDVDCFKLFNDSYGHLKGDEALKKVAAAIKKHSRRPDDLASRFGGEEFSLLLPGIAKSEAYDIATRLHQDIHALDIAFSHSTIAEVLTVSIGVGSMFCSADSSKDDIIARADKALYNAKQTGRNKVVVAADE